MNWGVSNMDLKLYNTYFRLTDRSYRVDNEEATSGYEFDGFVGLSSGMRNAERGLRNDLFVIPGIREFSFERTEAGYRMTRYLADRVLADGDTDFDTVSRVEDADEVECYDVELFEVTPENIEVLNNKFKTTKGEK